MDPNKATSEWELENKLMNNLESLGYAKRLDIKTDKDVEWNIKFHLERLNDCNISEEEFETYILKQSKNLNVFSAAEKIRDKFIVNRGKHDNLRLSSIDKKLENNVFEYSHQIQSKSWYKNIGDVTIFLNGFPICQIELKKPGVELKEAYYQIMRYKAENFDQNIFKFVQIYVISNDTYSNYFANHVGHKNKNKSFLFSWTDSKNKSCSNLTEFSNLFFEKETLFKLITKYTIVKNDKIMILRPYQFYAVEKITDKIFSTNELNNNLFDIEERTKRLNGYIFHATGSGKTLTSFKACQIISQDPNIKKVIFLVDRLDLNAQTMKEFKKFSGDDLDQTESSSHLKKQLLDSSKNLIVTTIQKLSRLLSKNAGSFDKEHSEITNSNIIFVIDECHRTQFGDMHKTIRKTFLKSRLIGFTGTPIFSASAVNLQVTSDIFGEELHRYMMTNAIRDGNVLPFRIEYASGPRKRVEVNDDLDKEAMQLDTKEFFSSDTYIGKIADFIALNNSKKTLNEMKAMLTTSSISNAIKYYKYFRTNHPNFKVATLFSYIDNDSNVEIDSHSKHELEWIIADFNKMYGQSFSTKTFKQYSNWIQNNLVNKSREIELIIVVNMLTTGFDCPQLNTIYLDKKLVNHNLIQTISRANRINTPRKVNANIVSFRTFKKDVDEAISLYNDSMTTGYIEKETLDEFIKKVNNEVKKLKKNWPNPTIEINEMSIEKQKDFIFAIRSVNKLILIAQTFIEFNFEDLWITKDEHDRYKVIQKKIYDVLNSKKEKDSILNDIDFELSFTKDIIDIDYICSLMQEVKISSKDFDFQVSIIMNNIAKISYKSKRDLIQSFVEKWIEDMKSNDKNFQQNNSILKGFIEYRTEKMMPKIEEYAQKYNLDSKIIVTVISKFEFEKKDIGSYAPEIRKSIKSKLGIKDNSKLIDKIKLFIIQIKESYDFIFKDETEGKEF